MGDTLTATVTAMVTAVPVTVPATVTATAATANRTVPLLPTVHKPIKLLSPRLLRLMAMTTMHGPSRHMEATSTPGGANLTTQLRPGLMTTSTTHVRSLLDTVHTALLPRTPWTTVHLRHTPLPRVLMTTIHGPSSLKAKTKTVEPADPTTSSTPTSTTMSS